MENVAKSKWKVRGTVLMIFVLGFLAGALSLNAYHAWRLRSGGENREARFEKILNQLQLTQEQQTQVKQIFSDTRTELQSLRKESEPKFENIRKQTDERLQKVLKPEQWQKFQQMREEMRKQNPRGRPARNN